MKRKQMLRSFGLIQSTLLLVGSAYAQEVTPASQFLLLPFNSEQMALGTMAHLDGVDAMLINPAQSSGIRDDFQWQGSGSFLQVIEGINFGNINVLRDISPKYGTVGLSAIYLNYGSIANVDVNGNDTGTFGASDFALSAHYSRTLFGVQLGINAKLINQNIASVTSTNFAFDFGLRKQFFYRKHRFWGSAYVGNLGPETTFVSEGSPLPRAFGGSVSYSLHRYLPKMFDVYVGPEVRSVITQDLILGVASEAIFRYRSARLYMRMRYYPTFAQNPFAFGGGGDIDLGNIRAGLSASLSPFETFANRVLVTAKVSYSARFSKPKPNSRPVLPPIKKGFLKKPKLKTDLEKIQDLQDFITQNYETEQGPSSLGSLHRKLRQKGQEVPTLNEGKIILFPKFNKLIYVRPHETDPYPHKIITMEGSSFNGKIIERRKKNLVIETSYGKMNFPENNLADVEDRFISK